MNTQAESINDLHQRITLTLTPEDYTQKYNKALNEMVKFGNFPGFRKGAVPMTFVKKIHGKAALADTIADMANQQLTEYLKSNQIDYMVSPILAEQQPKHDYTKTEDFVYIFDIALNPTINLDKLLKNQTFVKYNVTLNDEEIDRWIEKMRIFHYENRFPDQVELNDEMGIDMRKLDENGNETDRKQENYGFITLKLSEINDPTLQSELEGVQKDYVFTSNIERLMGTNQEFINTKLGYEIDKPIDENLQNSYKCTVYSIKREGLAEMNPAFFKKVYPEQDFEDETQFRTHVAQVNNKILNENAAIAAGNQVIEYLLTNASQTLAIAQDVLIRWIKQNLAKPEYEATLTQDYQKQYAPDFKMQAILNGILKQNNAEVQYIDVVQSAKMELKRMMAQYGYTMEMPDATLEKRAVEMIKKEEDFQRYFQHAKVTKVGLILEKIHTNYTIENVNATEFENQMEKQNLAEKDELVEIQ